MLQFYTTINLFIYIICRRNKNNLKVKGKEFNIALLKATNNYYKQLGPEVSGYFTELGQEFAHMFDFIVQMSAKDRLDLFEYLSKTYKNENSSN